jgi:glycosyltransferase involved in cell wall biosynthesis
MVTDGETGFVVGVDDQEALAERAIKVVSDRNTATTIIHQARNQCSRYTWEVVCGQWLQLYRDVAEK